MDLYNERLHDMLRVKRPHNSKAEAQWIKKYILCYPEAYSIPSPNGPMAYVIEVGKSKTMFSCHVDTVHREGGKQTIKFNKKDNTYYKTDGKPLGADDTAGCWLMLEMIDAGVPGTYVFHRGEECGGIGSSYIAENMPKFLEQFDRAVAFDRRGATSVITHQGWSRCASDDFAEALAMELNKNPECMYMPDDSGIFTDTANYVDYIPECTNIACGYANEHSGSETLHIPTLFALRQACCFEVDWENLPTERDPKVREVNNYLTYQTRRLTPGTNYGVNLLNMTKSEMLDMAYEDPDTFVALVRDELFGEEMYESENYYEDIKEWSYGL
jgi:hypothetical protein